MKHRIAKNNSDHPSSYEVLYLADSRHPISKQRTLEQTVNTKSIYSKYWEIQIGANPNRKKN
jgi:hypothetical protein